MIKKSLKYLFGFAILSFLLVNSAYAAVDPIIASSTHEGLQAMTDNGLGSIVANILLILAIPVTILLWKFGWGSAKRAAQRGV